jgi:hypothetical protein
MQSRRQMTQIPGDDLPGGTTMRMSGREERMPPRHYEAARVELHCPETAAHGRSLILEHATIYADGWARWAEDSHVIIGYIQAGRCCNPPEVSEL